MSVSAALQAVRKSDALSLEDILAYYIGDENDRSPIAQLRSPLDECLLPLPLSVNDDLVVIPTPSAPETGQVRRKAPLPASISDQHIQRLISALSEGRWVDALFDNKEVLFGKQASRYGWRLGRKVSEKASYSPELSYATAIYECSQSRGRVRGPEAYMKIYMQIPSYDERSKQILTTPSKIPQEILDEIHALKYLAEDGDDIATPKLLAVKRKTQTESMWVSGGFYACIVTERAPGSILDADTFWSFPPATQDMVRDTFKQSLEYLWELGVMPYHGGIDKLSWDSETSTCHIIDLEWAEIVDSPIPWSDDEFYMWGLSKETPSPSEPPGMVDQEITHQTVELAIWSPTTMNFF